MKTKFLIISFVIISLLGAFYLKANAQHCGSVYRLKSDTSVTPKYVVITAENAPITGTLIADETTITYSKTGARIETFSESVYSNITKVWEPYFKRVSVTYKKEGDFITKRWYIYLTRQAGINLQQWAKKHL